MRTHLASLTLPSSPEAATIAREAIRLTWPDLAGEQLDAVLVCASELIANAAQHGAPPIRLQVDCEEATVYLDVTDAGPGRPELGPAPLDATQGRGLLIVDALSTAWGCEGEPTGKRVWAAFDRAR